MTDLERALEEERRIINAAVVDGPLESRPAGQNSLGGARVYEPSGYPLPGCFNCGENDAVYEAGDAERLAHSWNALPLRNAQLAKVLHECGEMEWWAQNCFDVGKDAEGKQWIRAAKSVRRAIEEAAS